MNWLYSYLTLYEPAPEAELHVSGAKRIEERQFFDWRELVYYAALLAGIAAEGIMRRYQTQGKLEWGSIGEWVIATIIATAIFPRLFKGDQKIMDPRSSLFVQFCAVFTMGLGWRSAISSVVGVAVRVHS